MSLNKTNVPGFVKDSKTGMVTNVDKVKLEEYKMARNKAKEFKAMKDEIEALRFQVTALQVTVQNLLSMIQNNNNLLLEKVN